MKNILDIHDLFIVQLRSLYHAEVQLKPFLSRLTKHVSHHNLLSLLKNYREQVNDNFYLLEQVFEDLFAQEGGEKSKELKVMEDQTLDLLSRCKTNEVRDAALILCLQQMLHFKIASYGALCTYAKILGIYNDGVKLHQILEREKTMDRQLANLADLQIDREAFNYKMN